MLKSHLAQVLSVNVGHPRIKIRQQAREANEPRTYQTAIEKCPVLHSVWVGRHHVAGDVQADVIHHGGLDKAVHAHFSAHLQWLSDLSGKPVPFGFLGENLTLGAIEAGAPPSEQTFCLGDVIAVGEVHLEATQPRIPCFKQAEQLQVYDLVSQVSHSGRTGLYFRVVREGHLCPGDRLELLDRPHPDWSIDRMNQLLLHPKQPELWRELSAFSALGVDFRKRAERWTMKR